MQTLVEQDENHRLQLKESKDYRDQQIEKEKLLAFEIRKKVERRIPAADYLDDMVN